MIATNSSTSKIDNDNDNSVVLSSSEASSTFSTVKKMNRHQSSSNADANASQSTSETVPKNTSSTNSREEQIAPDQELLAGTNSSSNTTPSAGDQYQEEDAGVSSAGRKEAGGDGSQESQPEEPDSTTNKCSPPLRGAAAGSNLGRRGDSRMHKAVANRVANPGTSLLEALVKGGFKFPSHLFDAGNSDREIYDSDGVQLCQRKNQLSRRLRLNRKRNNALKTSFVTGNAMASQSYDIANDFAESNPSLPGTGISIQPNIMEMLLQAKQHQQQQQAQLLNNHYLHLLTGQNQQPSYSSPSSSLLKQKKRSFEQANYKNLRDLQQGDPDLAFSSLRERLVRQNDPSILSAGTANTPALVLFPDSTFSQGIGSMRSSAGSVQMNFGTGASNICSSTPSSHSAPVPTVMNGDVNRYFLQQLSAAGAPSVEGNQQFFPQNSILNHGAGNHIPSNGTLITSNATVGRPRAVSGTEMRSVSCDTLRGSNRNNNTEAKLNHAVEIYKQEHQDFVTKCLMKAGLDNDVACDPIVRSSFEKKSDVNKETTSTLPQRRR